MSAALSGLRQVLAASLAAAGVGAGKRLCCALSGGVDSLSLLHALAAESVRVGFHLQAVHVHHGLSPHAEDWARFCASQCAALDIPLQVFRVAVPPDDPAGPEAAARRVRLAVLEGISCDWLVFGHHLDDQAETVLFRLLRGAGVRGLAGMAALEHPRAGRSGRLRPWLGLRRRQIETAALAAGLCWVHDESNLDARYTRNALRHQVMPALQPVFPAAAASLARVADNARDAAAVLDDVAAQDACDCGGEDLRLERLRALSAPRLRNLLRWLLDRHGRLAPTRARLLDIERQLREVDAGASFCLAVEAGFNLCLYRGRVWFAAAQPATPPARLWQGEAVLPWGAGAVRLQVVSGSGLSLARLQAAETVQLRGRWPGLAMRTHAGGPRRSFRKLCQENGLPAWLRDGLPVLCVGDEAVWVGGLGCAADWRADAGEAALAPCWVPG